MPQRYELVVIVTDGGDPMLSSNRSVFVSVVPPNDNTPSFVGPFDFDIPENSISVNLTIVAEDMDPGMEGTVNFTLLSSDFSSRFTFDFVHDSTSSIGTLTVQVPFDREDIMNFTLTIEATDTGSEFFRRTSSQIYVFSVTDMNDNAPVFDGTPYTVSVGENVTGGAFLFQVSASDADSGPNAEITFMLAPGSDFAGTFDIEPTSGNVSVEGTLLRATTPSYLLTIVASDSLGLSSNTTLNVTVLEVNDNSPVFALATPRYLTILDDSPEGLSLLNISVTDADTGEPGEVELSLEQAGQLFRLQGADGRELVLNMVADLEVRGRPRPGVPAHSGCAGERDSGPISLSSLLLPCAGADRRGAPSDDGGAGPRGTPEGVPFHTHPHHHRRQQFCP